MSIMDNPRCPTCGLPLSRVENNIWICKICNMVYPVYRGRIVNEHGLIPGVDVELVQISGQNIAVLPSGVDVTETLKDPLFDKFLKLGPGKYKGPSTIADFLNLPPEQQQWYVDVFKQWKKIIKKQGLEKELKSIVE
ncbi:MAG: hypothetical protein QW209_06390 [Nitrososphaerota archaeon]